MISLVSWNRDEREENVSNRMCSFSGWLWKMKKAKKVIVPQWNKRWFSIEGRYFRWYEQANSTEMSGSVDLASIEGIKPVDSTQGAFQFVVIYPDRKLVLRAADQHDRSKWIRAIQAQTDLAKGGLGTGIIGDIKVDNGSPDLLKLKKKSLKSRSLESDLDRKLKELEALERQLKLEAEMLTFKESAQREMADRSTRQATQDSSSRSSSLSSRGGGDDRKENDSQASDKSKSDQKSSKHSSSAKRVDERRDLDSSRSRNTSISSVSVSKIIIQDKDDPDGEIDLLEDISSEPRKLNRRIGSKKDVDVDGSSSKTQSSSKGVPNDQRDSGRDKSSTPPSFEVLDSSKKPVKAAAAEDDEFDIPEVDLTVRKPARQRSVGKIDGRQRLSRETSPEPSFAAVSALSLPPQRVSRDGGPGPVGRTSADSKSRRDDSNADESGGGSSRTSRRLAPAGGSGDVEQSSSGASSSSRGRKEEVIDPDFDYEDLKEKPSSTSRRSRRDRGEEGRQTGAPAAEGLGSGPGSRPGSGSSSGRGGEEGSSTRSRGSNIAW